MKKIFSFLMAALLLTSCTSMDSSEPVTELQIEDLSIGSGESAKVGDTVEMHYTGTLLDGTVFDSSRPRGQTFSFTIGAGQVIQGWEEGIPGMNEGGTRKLTIPSDMAYGDSGVGPIPGGATLIFEVELVSIQE
ncbi:MAG: FKBP-type peptidyl-prolyl cis-trans isomerase [Candidatus Gracilibacteria bacterium]|jgi:peptidylprolyl isomerase/FKBP-type peptidyl-prolyl cis-trans isomerase FkpA